METNVKNIGNNELRDIIFDVPSNSPYLHLKIIGQLLRRFYSLVESEVHLLELKLV